MKKIEQISYKRSKPFMVGDTFEKVTDALKDVMCQSKYTKTECDGFVHLVFWSGDGKWINAHEDRILTLVFQNNILVGVTLDNIGCEGFGDELDPIDIDLCTNGRWYSLELYGIMQRFKLAEIMAGVNGHSTDNYIGLGVMEEDDTEYVVQISEGSLYREHTDNNGMFSIVRKDLSLKYGVTVKLHEMFCSKEGYNEEI